MRVVAHRADQAAELRESSSQQALAGGELCNKIGGDAQQLQHGGAVLCGGSCAAGWQVVLAQLQQDRLKAQQM